MSIGRILPFLFNLVLACTTDGQDASDCYATHMEFVNEQNEYYTDEEESPLMEEDLKRFESLNFFTYDENYCVEAKWVRTPDEKSFEMPTSTDRLPVYVKYGELHFEINEQKLVLSVYQNVEYSKTEEGANYLFVPFNDLTNGEESYGGGRYMDFEIPDSETVLIDLNNTYHPLCAYNHRYSCPIPPEENMLNVRVEAGAMYGINGEEGFKH